MRFALIALVFAGAGFSQAEKPATPPKATPAPAPKVDLARLWQLQAAAVQADLTASQTPEAIAAKEAHTKVDKEFALQNAKCGPTRMLGADPAATEDPKPLICVDRPVSTATK